MIHNATSEECVKIRQFWETHECTLSRNEKVRGYENLDLTHYNCGIGTSSWVYCKCGAKEDITDYDTW